MRDGYTYTTISASTGDPARIAVAFYLDAAARMHVYGRGGDRPQFGIAHGDVEVLFLVPHNQVGQADVELARELADKAASYAAEVSRLHAEGEARAANSAA